MYDRFESSLVIVGGSANRQNKLRANSRKWVRSSKIETPDYSSKCKNGNTPPVSTKSDDFSAGTTENLARHTKFSQIFYLGTYPTIFLLSDKNYYGTVCTLFGRILMLTSSLPSSKFLLLRRRQDWDQKEKEPLPTPMRCSDLP